MHETINDAPVREKTVIAGLVCRVFSDEDNSTEETMDELASLVETAGGCVVARAVQQRESPDPRTYLGEGKAAEVKQLADANGADLLVLDNELSPSQARNLENATGLRVLDRSGIILDIFAGRAKTAEGKLQVELAQYKYILPRLSGQGKSLSRQGASSGGIMTRGPGESKLETDRRRIRERISRLETELDELRRVRSEQRRRRVKNETPVVAIVGYTNAGKSTLLNTLTGSEIEANDRLFDTLDTTTRVWKLDDDFEVLLSDTVGFIRRLPHHLIQAFKATLEELSYADLILHVIDVSNPQWTAQAEVTDKLVRELAEGKPVVAVFNKADRCADDDLPRGTSPYGGPVIVISAKNGDNLELLRTEILKKLRAEVRKITLFLPFADSATLDTLHREAKIVSTEYTGEGIRVELMADEKLYGRVRKWVER